MKTMSPELKQLVLASLLKRDNFSDQEVIARLTLDFKITEEKAEEVLALAKK